MFIHSTVWLRLGLHLHHINSVLPLPPAKPLWTGKFQIINRRYLNAQRPMEEAEVTSNASPCHNWKILTHQLSLRPVRLHDPSPASRPFQDVDFISNGRYNLIRKTLAETVLGISARATVQPTNDKKLLTQVEFGQAVKVELLLES